MPSTTPTRDQFQTYADYGEGVRNNAKRGIELNERNGNKCATQNVRQVTQENGLCLPSQVLYHHWGRTWYSAMARAVKLLISRGNISVSMGLYGGLDVGLGLVD